MKRILLFIYLLASASVTFGSGISSISKYNPTAVTITGGTITGVAIDVGVPTGAIIDFAGPTCPSGYLITNTAPGTLARVGTYAPLFAAIGTAWGVGDGLSTYGRPYFPTGYTAIANQTLGVANIGAVISHTHTATTTFTTYNDAGIGPSISGSTGTINPTASTNLSVNITAAGGAANYAAGMGVIKCIKF